jgi:hypothetical protein
VGHSGRLATLAMAHVPRTSVREPPWSARMCIVSLARRQEACPSCVVKNRERRGLIKEGRNRNVYGTLQNPRSEPSMEPSRPSHVNARPLALRTEWTQIVIQIFDPRLMECRRCAVARRRVLCRSTHGTRCANCRTTGTAGGAGAETLLLHDDVLRTQRNQPVGRRCHWDRQLDIVAPLLCVERDDDPLGSGELRLGGQACDRYRLPNKGWKECRLGG